MKKLSTPVIHTREIEDQIIRKNFQNLLDYFERESQFVGFKHLTVEISKAETGLKVRHGLDYTPEDVIISKQTGPGTVTLDYDKFDSNFIVLDATDAVSLRLYVGTQGV